MVSECSHLGNACVNKDMKIEDYYQPCSTGQAPEYASRQYVKTGTSIQEKVEMWYLTPLRKMQGHEGFICLEICFLLYEKLLRRQLRMGNDETFSEGHPVFDVIGKQFRISRELAYEFWFHWRNGLLHRGMPGVVEGRTYWMTGRQEEAITVSDNHVSINPWIIRNVIVDLVAADRKIWTDADFPLAKELKEI
jgi:hypothetical protein